MNAGKTYAELNRDREEIAAGLLGNGSTTRDTREVDEARLDEALLALQGLKHLLGESNHTS